MDGKIIVIRIVALVLSGLYFNTAQALFVEDSDYYGISNDSIVEAQNIDAYFDKSFNALIEDANLVNISTSIAHAQIVSYGGAELDENIGTSFDYFSFNASAGSSVTIDVDCGYWAFFGADPCGDPDIAFGTPLSGDIIDSFITLIDPLGNAVASNDDGPQAAATADTGTDVRLDSFLEHSLLMAGLWTIKISDLSTLSDEISQFGSYQMNVSVSEVPVPASIWLFGTAFIWLFGASKRGQNPTMSRYLSIFNRRASQ